MKKLRGLVLILAVSFLLAGARAGAAEAAGKVNWVMKDGVYYAYNVASGQLIRSRRVGRYYTKKDGSRVINAFRKGKYYGWDGKRTSFRGGFIRAAGKLYYFRNRRKLKGFQKIGNHHYYFGREGDALTGPVKVGKAYRMFLVNGRMAEKNGWVNLGNRKYYVRNHGFLSFGFIRKDGKTYYQTKDKGILTGSHRISGREYYFNESGVLSKKARSPVSDKAPVRPGSMGRYEDLLFFTRYESGDEAYGQAGGDHGKAYGKYQFDYRYSLIPLLKYCYRKDPSVCREFKVFLNLKSGDRRLIAGNRKPIREAGISDAAAKKQSWDLAVAWKKVYRRDPKSFRKWQDEYAMSTYYMPVQNYLASRGIHLKGRSYVERGAVYSYAIQSGSYSAQMAVLALGITDAISSRDFLERLYDYRWKDRSGWNKNPLFLSRFRQEKEEAMSILKGIGG